MTDVLSALTPEEQAAIARLRHWTGLPLVACGGSYHSVGAATDADLVCDACARLAQENAELRDVKPFADNIAMKVAFGLARDGEYQINRAQAKAARYKAALRDLLDAIPAETATADPPLQAWIASAEVAIAEEP